MSKSNNIGHIGSAELISLPDQAIFDIPAKIDTGADSSAIWASNIREQDGLLTFKLFGPSSPYFTGTTIKVSDYQLASIKNSFGISEFRYKVRLKAKIGSKTIWVRFTLANRGNNRYPILIGRRTIKGKFLVDVSKRLDKSTCKVLLLSMARTDALKDYVTGLENHSKKLDITVATYADLDFTFGKKSSIKLAESQQDIADFDLVYFKTTAKHLDIAAAVGQYLTQRGVAYVDYAIQHFPASSKLYQYAILAGSTIPLPKSVFILGARLSKSFEKLEKSLGLPFVLKDIHGKKGNYNYLVRDEESFLEACKLASKAGVRMIAQAFIPNDGDYRILVLGRRVELVIYRQAADSSTHLNNTSQGGKATLIKPTELPTIVRKHSINAATLLDRQIAGIDMVQDNTTGKWYCFEVNDGPQLATGSFLQEKQDVVAAFLERKVEG